jgi:PhnB protein
MQVQPYLFFPGTCEKAVEFYRTALGAEVLMLSRYGDSPDPATGEHCKPEDMNKVMHASFKIGDSVIMASDDPMNPDVKIQGVSLSLTVSSDDEAKQVYDKLAEGGQAAMPITKTFFASSFGMVVDQFGVSWMVVAGM